MEAAIDGNDDEHGNAAIDEIYDLLERIESDIAELKTDRRRSVEVYAYSALNDAVLFLDELGYSSRLGLSGPDLSKFQRMAGNVAVPTLQRLAGRVVGLLKAAEGEFRDAVSSLPAPVQEPAETPPGEPVISERVIEITWVENDRDDNADLIADLTALLNEAVDRAKGTNLPEGKRALTEFQRKALIAMLETAVFMLKGPLVEKTLIKRLSDAAAEGAANSLKKGAEVGLGMLLKRLWDLLQEFLKNLS